MNKEIYYDKEAIDKLHSGIEKLARAVGATMGPNGSTVIISDKDNYGKYKATKDGVSIANEIRFQDPVENIGAQLVKEAAQKTLDDAGDGTTTSTILAASFISNLKDFDSIEINKAFNEIIPKVLTQLKLNSRELKHKDIKYVANISANNDVQIGELIQEAFDHSHIVKVEESNNFKDSIELVDGMSLDVSYLSKHFVNNTKGECIFENPNVLIIDGKLENLKPFENIIKKIAFDKEELLIICEHVHDTTLRLLENNVLNGSLKVCVMKSPGFAQHRKDLLRDIADFTGASVIIDQTKPFTVGKLLSSKISKSNSILVKHPDVEIDSFIGDLKELSKYADVDRHLVEKRIENLTGKVSILKVGGQTETEMKERKDRYDDAVLAVACALEEGIVEGGGQALFDCSYDLMEHYIELKGCVKYILESIEQPIRIINLNKIIEENYSGIEYRNMFDLNIIDPLKVTRCALENAVSVAKTILSTKTIVLDPLQWKNL